MRTPIQPEMVYNAIEEMMMVEPGKRIKITTRYGNHELTVDEIYHDSSTKTICISVNTPETHE